MRQLQIGFFLLILWAILGTGCESVDLSLVNQVKRFEPEWMNLSEKVTYIDRNLGITHRRYDSDFEETSRYISDPAMNERTQLYGLRSQYKNMVSERDAIEARFDIQKKKFVETVNEFNRWQNALMKRKLEQGNVKTKFVEFKQTHSELRTEMDEIQTDLIRNIEEHNSILKRITSALKLYTNYDISPK